MLDDPEGLQVVGKRLGLELKRNDDLTGQPVVAVLVASNRDIHQNMMDARTRLLMYSKQFCTVFAEPIMGSSLVSWVRNDLVAGLYSTRKKFTHVLFIDDDMTFEPDSLVKMLRHEADVVGALYTCRSDPPTLNVHLMNTRTTEARRLVSLEQPGIAIDSGGLGVAKNSADTLTVGTGFMLIKREVLDRVGEQYVNCEYEKDLWKLTDEQIAPIAAARRDGVSKTGNAYWFQLLPRLCGYAESGEDTSFCLKAAMCGFKVAVDTSIRPGHIGEYTYSYDDFLQYQSEQIAKAKRQKLFF